MKVAMRRNTFLIYVILSPNVGPRAHEIPSHYQEFNDVFKEKNMDTLPKHQPYNCPIDFVEEVQPPFRPIYNLSQDKVTALHEYIDENLEKGFIQHSKSPTSALILFVKKKDGSL
jgi:hypothetical protein